MDGSQKNAGRHQLVRCVIVAREAHDLRADLFTERLGVPVIRQEDARPDAANPLINSGPGIQLVAAIGDPSITDLLAWLPGKNSEAPEGSKNSTCILKWNTPARPGRMTALDVDNFLILGFNGARFRPEGLLGWGFRKITDALDAGGDPVRMLTHLSRTLRCLNPSESRLECSKAAIAHLPQGANATKIVAATDGDALLVELEIVTDTPAFEAGAKLAGWLDRTSGTINEPCVAWVQKRRTGGLKAGIIIGAGPIPVGLVIDETDPDVKAIGEPLDEPKVEPPTQKGYNVA